ncbi:MAG: hypothetical protein ACU84Q_07200 [Gammaproteobacteria bacterium]
MISKADPQLEQYAQVGVAAADNASRLSTLAFGLDLMAGERMRLLQLMNHDWSNAGVVFKNRAEPRKQLMTVPE